MAAPLAAQDTPTGEPDATTEMTPEPIEMTFGSGAFNLLQPTESLLTLSSYQATLMLSFDGTNDGQLQQSSRTYTMRVDENAVRQMTFETAGDAAAQRWMMEINGTLYERRGEGACTASVIEPGNTLAEQWEPAGFLDSVIGAEEAGTETVNAVVANHYTFDEAALGVLGIAESGGELWIAADGGYLVRYLLETTGGADYFGDGIEGTLTWDYQLTDVDQPLVLELPEDCPVGILDVPVLPDAADFVQFPGMTTYTTGMTLADATAFYEEQIAALGAEASFPTMVEDTFALLEYPEAEQLVTVMITREDEITSVMIAVSNPPPVVAAPTAFTFSIGGQSVDIPLLPDATNVFSVPEGSGYTTLVSIDEAAAFYEEQLLALAGQIVSPLTLFGNIGMLEIGLSDQLITITILGGDEGNSLYILVDPPGSFSGGDAPPPTQAPTLTAPTSTPSSNGCPGGAATIPVLPDATNLMQMPGVTSYNTQTSLADAAAFYEAQITAAGGQVSSTMPATDAMAMLEFTQGGQYATVMIIPAGGVNSVYISAIPSGVAPPPADCDAPAPADTQAGTAPVAASAACSVSTGTSANERSGPGTSFALAGTFTAGTNAPVLGQATGADGFVWWQLGEGVWVRSDVVNSTGDCAGVPAVQP